MELWLIDGSVVGAKYDCEQRYQSITRQCEELIETNNQLQRTIKDAELRIQQLEGNKNQVTYQFVHFRMIRRVVFASSWRRN